MNPPPGPPPNSSPPAVGPPQTRGYGWLKWGVIGVGSVPADSYDVTLDTCEVDEPGGARAAGTITNTSKVSGRRFVVHVRFNNPDGTLLDTTETSVGRLRDGQMVNWRSHSPTSRPTRTPTSNVRSTTLPTRSSTSGPSLK